MARLKIWPAAPFFWNWSSVAISPCPSVAPPVGVLARFLFPTFHITLLLLPVLWVPLNRYRSSWLKTPAFFSLFQCLLSRYHYLSFWQYCGRKYEIYGFWPGHNPLACLLFGSAAWKCAPRDDFIGWYANTRKANLQFLTNNMRFLILPWVRVPHLASHILGRVAKVNKSRLTDCFNKIPGERKRGHLKSILRHLFFSLFMFIPSF